MQVILNSLQDKPPPKGNVISNFAPPPVPPKCSHYIVENMGGPLADLPPPNLLNPFNLPTPANLPKPTEKGSKNASKLHKGVITRLKAVTEYLKDIS